MFNFFRKNKVTYKSLKQIRIKFFVYITGELVPFEVERGWIESEFWDAISLAHATTSDIIKGGFWHDQVKYSPHLIEKVKFEIL